MGSRVILIGGCHLAERPKKPLHEPTDVLGRDHEFLLAARDSQIAVAGDVGDQAALLKRMQRALAKRLHPLACLAAHLSTSIAGATIGTTNHATPVAIASEMIRTRNIRKWRPMAGVFIHEPLGPCGMGFRPRCRRSAASSSRSDPGGSAALR